MNGTIAGILKNIFAGVLPLMLTAAVVALPPPFGTILGAILKIPIIGNLIQQAIQWGVGWLIDNGVIALKVEMIDILTAQAKAAYAPQITLLRQMQAQPAMTPEQQKAFEDAFQNIIKNHVGVVNA